MPKIDVAELLHPPADYDDNWHGIITTALGIDVEKLKVGALDVGELEDLLADYGRELNAKPYEWWADDPEKLWRLKMFEVGAGYVERLAVTIATDLDEGDVSLHELRSWVTEDVRNADPAAEEQISNFLMIAAEILGQNLRLPTADCIIKTFAAEKLPREAVRQIMKVTALTLTSKLLPGTFAGFLSNWRRARPLIQKRVQTIQAYLDSFDAAVDVIRKHQPKLLQDKTVALNSGETR